MPAQPTSNRDEPDQPGDTHLVGVPINLRLAERYRAVRTVVSHIFRARSGDRNEGTWPRHNAGMGALLDVCFVALYSVDAWPSVVGATGTACTCLHVCFSMVGKAGGSVPLDEDFLYFMQHAKTYGGP